MDETRSLDLKLVIAMMRAQRRVFEEPAALLKAEGITPTQFGVLEVLLHKGDQTVGELLTKMLATGGNLTVVLKNLEKAGAVVRLTDESDGRIGRIHLTETGRALIERLFPSHAEALSRALAVLTNDEKRLMVEWMKRVGKQ